MRQGGQRAESAQHGTARTGRTCARPTATTTSCSQLGDRSAINLAAASYCKAAMEARGARVGVGGVGVGWGRVG